MLVIERKSGQEVEIDGPARIRVVRRAGKILLLIDADLEVKIFASNGRRNTIHGLRQTRPAFAGQSSTSQ